MIAPRLSIIIATWNAGGTLERCLNSIIEQSSQDWELLISDGGSTDDTISLVERYSKHIAWFRSEKDNGIYDAWNSALEHAKGEYVCFLGADDAFHSPSVLSEIFAAAGSNQYDLITSLGLLRDVNWTAGRILGSSWTEAKLPRRIRVCHPGLLHRRRLFDDHGTFDSRYRIAADMDFLLRLPAEISSLHLPMITVDVQDAGISRRQFWLRIKEYRDIHSASPRVGPSLAWLYWADKAWRRPIALLLGLSH